MVAVSPVRGLTSGASGVGSGVAVGSGVGSGVAVGSVVGSAVMSGVGSGVAVASGRYVRTVGARAENERAYEKQRKYGQKLALHGVTS